MPFAPFVFPKKRFSIAAGNAFLCRTRIAGKHLAEVIEACGWASTQGRVGQIQQRTILCVLTEVVGAGRLVIAESPDAALTAIADAEERVEGSGFLAGA